MMLKHIFPGFLLGGGGEEGQTMDHVPASGMWVDVVSITGIFNPSLSLLVLQAFGKPLVDRNGATRWKDPASLTH